MLVLVGLVVPFADASCAFVRGASQSGGQQVAGPNPAFRNLLALD